MIRPLLLILNILYSLAITAQSDKDEILYIIPEEYSSIHHKGEQALLMKKYGEALHLFKKVLKKYPNFPPALRSAGACQELMRDYESASKYYEAAIESNPNFSRAMYFEIGNIHYRMGLYDLALQRFEQFDSLLKIDSKQFTYNGIEERKVEQEYLGKLEISRTACHIALDSIQFWDISVIENMGSGVNTKADEYFPFLTNNCQTIYYTSRKDKFSNENLFVSSKVGRDWGNGSLVQDFNTREHEGMATLVRDGRRFYFTACNRDSVMGTCDIWEGKLDGDRVHDLAPAKGAANSQTWDSQASINCDGTTLYFASSREGGYGGTDIWKSDLLPNGKWSEPTNMGNNINSVGDEEAPFITNDGKVLYFSSTGHIGMGEQDLFMSRKTGENLWSQPINLGKTVNSSYRELGFFLSADGKTGYYASDRPGGKGGMDIYHFELSKELQSEPVTYVEGYVQDSITRLPVQTMVDLIGRQSMMTDENGRFFLCVKANENLDIEVIHKHYHPYQRSFPIPEWHNATFYRLDILLDPLFKLPTYTGELLPEPTIDGIRKKPRNGKIEKHTILFDFDDSKLKADASIELVQFIIAHFAEKEPEYIEILGFTDEHGDEAYNFELSEKRAETIGLWLKDKGIQVDNIQMSGMGESMENKPDWEKRKVEIILYLDR